MTLTINDKLSDIAVIGMAVMGKNLALNLASRGFQVSIYNRSSQLAMEVKEEQEREHPDYALRLCGSLGELVASLQKPRKILMMVKAGQAVDNVIEGLLPYLEKGDILIDGGNSYFKDTNRRLSWMNELGLHFVGLGVSGGEMGARLGPALMPGCSPAVYQEIRPLLDSIAAKAEDGTPCAAYMGEGGAGHYVKMVHNGIEYADMQLIAEVYDYLKTLHGLDASSLATTFASWQKSDLSSYLIEITATILSVEEADSHSPLLEKILDVSKQKGTGKWTNLEAIDLGVDTSVLSAGLQARFMSMQKAERVQAEGIYGALTAGVQPQKPTEVAETTEAERKQLSQIAASALLVGKIIAYAQGFALYRAANQAYGFQLQYANIAATFRAGCIIRSKLLEPMMQAFTQEPNLPNLLLSPSFAQLVKAHVSGLRKLVTEATAAGLSVPALSAALAYLDAYRRGQSSANLIQAQRDFFGAHTYQRIDKEGIFHNHWEQAQLSEEDARQGRRLQANEVQL